MKDKQKYIYFVTDKSEKHIANNLFIEYMKKRDFEVIYMIDMMKEYIVQMKFDEKQFACLLPKRA